MDRRKIYLNKTAVFILLFSTILIGCDIFLTTPINKILENPRDYSGKTVTVSGEVTEIFSLFVIKYIVVKDNTGEITVITKRPLPKKGTLIRIRGKVEEAFSIGDQQFIVIVEEDKK
ncbi:MAG: hypothetical protein AB1632_11740 [Nitrospirota bacterium]